jgi:uncharacterized phage-associated protein
MSNNESETMNKEKIINSILFILNELGGKSDFHKIFKILYFADQKHLVTYGFPITYDFYIAMPNGPVPSKSYDMLKAIKGDSFWSNIDPNYKAQFEVEGYNVVAKQIADIEELAESDIECLVQSIAENKDLSFGQLSDKSHKLAWEKARGDETNFDNRMDTIDIAKELGIDDEMEKYISVNLETQKILSTYAEFR